ncbi:MAG: menaquinone biosynthesis decarboxylase [Bacteroidota bacterium]|nr:menaquinone biosynthesis decarboxylase [Bacteroidota bacterium]
MGRSGSEVFIGELLKAGELRIIDEPVSPDLEITEITDRISKMLSGGDALLFNNTGTKFPVLINAFGSDKRLKIIFKNRSPEEISSEILHLLKTMIGPTSGLFGQFSKISGLRKFASWMPKKKSGRGMCQEQVMETPDLSKLPVLTCWPADGGPFITLPLVHTKDPETGIRNVGMYRLQVLSNNETGMHWHVHKTGARHYREYKRKGLKMPVAIALGGDPVYAYSATAPLPDGIDEYMLAGFLRQKPVELVKCLTQDMWVPADADFILEGYVDPEEELVLEGPFGDHTGYYSLADYYPKFHITSISHRKGAVYPATIVGIPPQEDAWIAKATETIFKEPLKLAMIPELTGFHLPEAGVAHNIGLFSIDSDYPGQGRKTLNTIWGAGQMMFTKFAVIVDQKNNLKDYTELARTITKRVDPLNDVVTTIGPLDVLDHASERFAIGGKLGLDATGEIMEVGLPDDDNIELAVQMLRSSNPSIRHVNTELVSKGISLLVVLFYKTHASQVADFANEIANSGILSKIKFVVMTDIDFLEFGWYELAWIVGSHVDPDRDCMVIKAADNAEKGILILDATRKTRHLDGFARDWPNPVVMDEKTICSIDENWDKYELGSLIPSPSNRYKIMMNGTEAIAEE